MRKTTFFSLITVLVMTWPLNACVQSSVQGAVAAPQDTPAAAAEAPTAAAETTPAAAPPIRLPAALEPIDADNAKSLVELAQLRPDFPPYEMISPDGRVGARADLQGIDVLDVESGAVLMHIPLELPDCEYGWDRYFSFSRDGSFLAIAAQDTIQVWQVGGGMIYEAAYSTQGNTDAATCGAEIPQLALSPDGSLLAVSGVDYSDHSARDYFRVVAILQNQVLYEWNGSQDSLHGDLYSFRGLGFSTDGSVLQTFDPSLYNAFSGEEYTAFRFWSAADGQELPRSAEVISLFPAADQYYVLQGEDSLELKSRLDGQLRASLNGTGCSQAAPCDVRLSSQVGRVALLNTSTDVVPYHRDEIATHLSVWDWESGQQLSDESVFLRNLDGLWLSDAGEIRTLAAADKDAEGVPWWTSSYNFAGLLNDVETVSFLPQVLNGSKPGDCYYCGTCSLDLQDLQVNCRRSFNSAEGNMLEVAGSAGRITLKGENGDLALDLPASAEPEWDLRLLGYAEAYQTAFYCLDDRGRSETCVIERGGENARVTEVEDIYALRFSADGGTAAYIDRREKSLYLVNLKTGKLTKMDAYQSRAWFVNPSFASTGAELVYVIQNVKDETILSLEWVDGAEGRVLRRSTLDTDRIGQPSVLSLGAKNGLVALGTQDGSIVILDQEKGKLLTSWQAGVNPLIGLVFTGDDTLLVSLDSTGLIQLWGVE